VNPRLKVLVAGARGFIGRALCPALEHAGHHVVYGVRPTFDVDNEPSVRAALHDVDVAVWLVHGLKRSPTLKQRAVGTRRDYASWETDTAARFARCARDAGVKRIVYLGGIDPRASNPSVDVSRHLSARLATGAALRTAGVDVVELRAAMIVGAGSESWVLARDGAARLPAFLAPPWLASRTHPVALDDVVAALVASIEGADESHASSIIKAGVYDVPGPERLTGRQVVERTLALMGRRALVFRDVPMFPRRVAAFLAPYVTRANASIARELFRGVGLDLLVEGDGIFAFMPGHRRLSFDEAVLRALADDRVSLKARLYESALRRLLSST
jgi:uncharacterized protein YbjT (DUF2867 family)